MTQQAQTGAALRVLGAMAIIGLIDSAVPRLAQDGGLWQFHSLRAAIVLPTLVIYARISGRPILPRRPMAVAARSALVGTAMMIYFGCLAFLPVGQVAAGLFTAPIFVLVLSVLVLGQRFVPMQGVAVAVGFGGVLLVLQLSQSPDLLTVLPVLAGLFYALGALCTRHLCADEDILAVLFGFFLVMGVMGGVGLMIFALWPELANGSFVQRGWTAPTPMFMAITVLQAFGSILAVGLLTRAYQLGNSATVSAFEFSLMIFATLWGWLLLDQALGVLTLAGMALIILSGVLILVPERR